MSTSTTTPTTPAPRCGHTKVLGGNTFVCLVTGPHGQHHMRSEEDHRRISASA